VAHHGTKVRLSVRQVEVVSGLARGLSDGGLAVTTFWRDL
jgi:hypothetical protein